LRNTIIFAETEYKPMSHQNFFHTLGLTHEATQDEIKIAYKKLAVEFHPDRNADPNAEERFKEINEAYSVLSDFYLRLLHEKDLGLSKPIAETPTPTEQEKEIKTDEELPPEVFPLKQHWLILLVPFVVLLLIGVGKIVFSEGKEPEKGENSTRLELETPNQIPEIENPTKAKSIQDLRRIWTAKPEETIYYIDSLKSANKSLSQIAIQSLDSFRVLALGRLIDKSAYYFRTENCAKGKELFDLAVENKVQFTAHLRKQLDFSVFQCAKQIQKMEWAMELLDSMERRYTHTYSILSARAQLYHHNLESPEMAIPIYEKLRFLHSTEKIDEKFTQFWTPNGEIFGHGKLMAEYSLAVSKSGNSELSQKLALKTIGIDSTQVLPYEIIAQNFQTQKKQWSACQYWKKALLKGSKTASEALEKYCE
jgi:curved DNA-binding protein CbpA